MNARLITSYRKKIQLFISEENRAPYPLDVFNFLVKDYATVKGVPYTSWLRSFSRHHVNFMIELAADSGLTHANLIAKLDKYLSQNKLLKHGDLFALLVAYFYYYKECFVNLSEYQHLKEQIIIPLHIYYQEARVDELKEKHRVQDSTGAITSPIQDDLAEHFLDELKRRYNQAELKKLLIEYIDLGILKLLARAAESNSMLEKEQLLYRELQHAAKLNGCLDQLGDQKEVVSSALHTIFGGFLPRSIPLIERDIFKNKMNHRYKNSQGVSWKVYCRELGKMNLTSEEVSRFVDRLSAMMMVDEHVYHTYFAIAVQSLLAMIVELQKSAKPHETMAVRVKLEYIMSEAPSSPASIIAPYVHQLDDLARAQMLWMQQMPADLIPPVFGR